MRLGKLLARSGVASRRASEELIFAGRVTVGGEVVTDPARDVDEGSGVAVDGERVSIEPHEAWVVNKPRGVVSTAHDPQGRRTVVELVDSRRRLYPVGRLDADTTGLILLTNDGELANRLTHPRYGVERAYLAGLQGPAGTSQLRRLRRGVTLDDGPTQPARVRRLAEREIEIVLREGRNRQVRRMLEAVGNRVLRLERRRIGPLELGSLARGDARRLEPEEVERLWQDAGG